MMQDHRAYQLLAGTTLHPNRGHHVPQLSTDTNDSQGDFKHFRQNQIPDCDIFKSKIDTCPT